MRWLAPAAAWLATGGTTVGLAFAHVGSGEVLAVFLLGAIASVTTTLLVTLDD